MAKIPSAQFNRGISTNVQAQPTQSISAAGIQGRALSQLGQGVSQLGRGIGALEQAREKAADETFLLKEKNNFRITKSRRERAIQRELEGKDPGNYTERQQEWYAEQREEALERAESNNQKQLIDRFYTSEANSGLLKDEIYESTSRVKVQKTAIADSKKKKMNLSFESAKLSDMSTAVRDHQLDVINSNVLNDAEKKEALTELSDIVTANLQGMYHQGKDKLIEAKAFLEGKTQYQAELALIDPKSRSKLLTQFDKKIKQEADATKRLAVAQAKDLRNFVLLAAETGGIVDPSVMQQAKDTIKGLEGLEGRDALVAKESLKNSLETVEFANSLTRMTVKEINELDVSKTVTTKDIAEAKVDLETIHERQALVSRYKKKLAEDPAGLILSENPSVKDGTKEILSLQKTKGVLNPQVFSKRTKDQVKAILENSANKSDELRQLQQQFPLAKEGLAQMAMSDKALIPFVMATEFSNEFTRTKLLDLNHAQVNERYKNEVSSDDADLKRKVNEELNDFSRAFGRNDRFVNTMTTKTQAMVKDAMLNNRNLSLDEAVEDVVNKTFRAEYDIAESKDSRVLLSGQARNFKKDIEAFMDTYSSDKNLTAMEEELGIQLKNQPGVTGFKSTKDFLKQAIESGFEYRINSGRNGIIPVFVGDDGRLRPFYIEEDGPEGKQLQPLQIPFDDMVSTNGKYTQVVLDKLNEPFFSGLKQSNPDAFKKLSRNLEKSRQRNLKNLRSPTNE